MTKGKDLTYTLTVEKPSSSSQTFECIQEFTSVLNTIMPLGIEPLQTEWVHAADRCEKAVRRRQNSLCIREFTSEAGRKEGRQ